MSNQNESARQYMIPLPHLAQLNEDLETTVLGLNSIADTLAGFTDQQELVTHLRNVSEELRLIVVGLEPTVTLQHRASGESA